MASKPASTDGPGRRRLLSRRTLVGGGMATGGALALGLDGCSSAVRPVRTNASDRAPRLGGTLRVGGTGARVPADYFAGNVLGSHVATWLQFAWPLFLPSETVSEPEYALAEAYRVSPDGLTHTLTLRSGLTFHDGSPLDAEAVAKNIRSQLFTNDPLRDKGSYGAALGFDVPPVVREVEATADTVVRLRLSQPRADLRKAMWYFCMLNPAIMARKDYGTDVGALRDAGSGPFRMVRFEPGNFVEFERYDGFFAAALLDRLRYENFPEAAALGLALRGGEVDVALGLAKDDQDQLAADPSFVAYVGRRPTKNVFFWWEKSPRIPILQDARVREAIWLATNRDAYREAFFARGTAVKSSQPAAVPGSRLHDPGLVDKPYDPERARQLLDEAGVSELVLKIVTPPSDDSISDLARLYEAMGQDLQRVGIQVDLKVTDEGTAGAAERDFYAVAFDDEDELLLARLFVVGLGAGYQPPDPRGDQAARRLYDEAAAAVDPTEQQGRLRRLMRLNDEEILMGIPLADIAVSAIARRGVRDFRVAMTADPQHRAWLDA